MYIFEQDGDYVNFNGGGNLWRIHKNSQCVAWHWDETGDLFFDVYDQQYVVKAENIATVTIGGVVLSTAADFETNIKLVFPGLAGGASSYLVYTALLNQPTGPTDTPNLVIMQNTIGSIIWTRAGTGSYLGTLSNAFTANKTVCVPTCQYSLIGLWGNLPFEYGYSVYPNPNNNDEISVDVYKTSDGTFADLYTAIFETPIFIRIEVYS